MVRPMPDPHTLAEYEKVLPGSADRLIRAYESTTVDASKRDDAVTDATVWVQRNGAGWAFFLLLGCFVASVLFFVFGNEKAGAAFIGAPVLLGLTSMVTSFIRKPKDR